MMQIKIFALLLCLFPMWLQAQQTETMRDRRAQVQQLKHEFLKREIRLSDQEESAFMPLYRQFEARSFELRSRKLTRLNKQADSVEEMTEAQAEKLLEEIDAVERELVLLRANLHRDLRPVIGTKKIIKLRKAEAEFQRKLLQQYRGGRKR